MIAHSSQREEDSHAGAQDSDSEFTDRPGSRTRRVLLVDERPDSALRFGEVLSRAGIVVVSATSLAEARILLSESEYDVAILHEQLSDGSGLDLLRELVRETPSPQILMLASKADVAAVVECIRLGAVDYLAEPLGDEMLRTKVEKAFETSTLRKQNEILSRPTQKSNAYFELTESSTERIRGIFDLIERYALAAPAPVLIVGETGVGKERAARTLHNRSPRAHMPFVALNCATFEHSMFESELFGHEKGAFTGAHARKLGLMELANGGTLFLDEIGDMPLSAQAKLLRTLEERRFRRVGGNKLIHSDFWVISATNKEFEPRLSSGEFRPDLYYRLSTLLLRLPALRERVEDIPDLVTQICKEMLGRHTDQVTFDDGVLEAFERYDWPGNIRELRNVVERSLIVHGDYRIRLPAGFGGFEAEEDAVACTLMEERGCTLPMGGVFLGPIEGRTLKDIEREAKRRAVEATLEKAGGNQAEAASILGVSARTLSRILSGEAE